MARKNGFFSKLKDALFGEEIPTTSQGLALHNTTDYAKLPSEYDDQIIDGGWPTANGRICKTPGEYKRERAKEWSRDMGGWSG